MAADKLINDLWNDLVEQPASSSVRVLRDSPLAATPNPISMEKISGLAQTSLDALFHLFWAFRSRNPQTPPAWGGITEDEYVDLLQDPAKNQEYLTGLQQKYQVVLLTLADGSAPGFALSDYTVFPLPPVRSMGVLCLPIAPHRALLMMDKRVDTRDLHSALADINLGEVSHGAPGTIVCLPPGRNWADPGEQDAIKREVKAAKRKWMPKVVGQWSPRVDHSI